MKYSQFTYIIKHEGEDWVATAEDEEGKFIERGMGLSPVDAAKELSEKLYRLGVRD